ncbi:YciI family protein [Kribbella sp. NPDC026611]|uniref:YciI family protein n=1 Tax=Kribbella sp. NPDC026611 TaxID=3154911 RepID=UPI00340E19AA
MKFLLLIHNNAEALEGYSEEQLMEMSGGPAAVVATARELQASGELLSILSLKDPRESKRVQLVGGTPVVSDRPFLETKEFLAGAIVVDCASLDRVLELAARIPLVELRRVEIREVHLDEEDFISAAEIAGL